jgi:hypothetical protein
MTVIELDINQQINYISFSANGLHQRSLLDDISILLFYVPSHASLLELEPNDIGRYRLTQKLASAAERPVIQQPFDPNHTRLLKTADDETKTPALTGLASAEQRRPLPRRPTLCSFLIAWTEL